MWFREHHERCFDAITTPDGIVPVSGLRRIVASPLQTAGPTYTATVRARNDRYYQRTERVAVPVSAFT